jgi:hypothetical protein
VDPRTALDDVEKRKCLTLPGFELRPLSRPARSHRYTDEINFATKQCYGDGEVWLSSGVTGQDKGGITRKSEPVHYNGIVTLRREQNKCCLLFHE